ncbi:alpha beta-hydrolase [Panaeolus papilionaceus]|nr:alpha beta-hydrolase [Panaeolus papilionaceus]
MLAPLHLALCLAGILLPVNAAAVVDLGYAKYQGVPSLDPIANTTNTKFIGIRYAANPIGPLRFSAPHPPPIIPGITIADTDPPQCPQAGFGLSPTTPFRGIGPSAASSVTPRHIFARQSANLTEDCLFLNVFVPGNLGDKKNLPVVFWIHGGGYILGSAAGFNGNDLIREAGGNVVAVVIQYRLGAYGFLAGQKVKEGGALNAGILDQQFALQWVQRNIRKFGGDPNKVTIWGESAGAGSVLQHIVANGGKTSPPLFRGAITSSLYVPPQYKFNDPISESIFSNIASQSGCGNSKNTLACLRGVDLNTLQNANMAVNSIGFFGTFVFSPVVDGTFITDRPSAILAKGKFNGKMLLAVTNTLEGANFVDSSTASTVQVADYVSNLFPKTSAAQVQAAAKQYQGTGTNIAQAIGIMGEGIFICPTYNLLKAFNRHSFKAEFAIPPGNHGDDVAYYFPNGNTPRFANAGFDKAFPQSFLSFVMALNTNAKFDPTNITPSWPEFDGSNEMLFNKTASNAPDIRVIETNAALLKRCNFWESISAVTAQ